ncbi:MAG: J domain-containing protein [Bryobacteraceae bacterium]
MTYYEHFGLTPEATQDEIHKAYRSLCRLIHPDHQTCDELRTLAESQMRWANQVYQTLRDPDRRREYDLTLEVELSPAPGLHSGLCQSGRWVFLIGRWRHILLWYGLAAIAAAALAWVLSGHRIASRRVEAIIPAEPAGAIPARSRMAASSRPSTRISRGQAPQASGTQATILMPMKPEAPDALLPPPIAAPDPLTANSVFGSVEPLAPPKRFQGTWYYVLPAKTDSPRPLALYPPEFIEAAIVETGATIEGRYRARYVIPDRAISPNVVFQFSGAVDGDEARLVWMGSGGSRGEGRLRLLSESSIELSWAARKLSPDFGLAAGRAVLVRQRSE